MPSLDMTICRRCGQPMAAVVSAGSIPRYLCRTCGDLDLSRPAPSPVLPAVKRSRFIAGPAVVHPIAQVRQDPLHDRIKPLHARVPPEQSGARHAEHRPTHFRSKSAIGV